MTATPASIPEFLPGVHYRRSGSGRWKWVLLRPLVVRFPRPLFRRTEYYRCLDGNGKMWLEIRPCEIRIETGYAWNGNTSWFDDRGTMLSSGAHDPIFQFSGCDGWPESLTNEWADELYFRLARGPMKYINSVGLAIFSSARWARRPGDGSRVCKMSILD